MNRLHLKSAIALLLLALIGAPAFGQISTKPAQKGFVTNSGLLYQTADAACLAEAPAIMNIYNYTIVDVYNCAGGTTAISTLVSSMTYTGVKTDPQNGQLYCGDHYTTTRTVAGSQDCGVTLGTTVTNNDGYTLNVGEVRVCESADGWSQYDTDTCYRAAEPYPPDAECPKCGNPTSVGGGNKQEGIVLFELPSGPRRTSIELRYSNRFHLAGGILLGEPSWFLEPADRRLLLSFVNSSSTPRVISSRGLGRTEVFRRNVDGSYRSFDPQVILESVSGQWKRIDYREGTVEAFDGTGRLLSLRYFGGGGVDLTYPDSVTLKASVISSVTGQQIQLNYAADSGRLDSVLLPNTSSVGLTYQNFADALKNVSDTYLKAITFPDGTSKSLDYVAGMTLPPHVAVGVSSTGKQVWSVTPGRPSEGTPVGLSVNDQGRAFFNLSGVTDENGTAYSSFEYDSLGHVLTSKHAGDTYKYTFTYQQGRTEVVDPLQSKFTFYFQTVNEQSRVTSLARAIPANPAYYRSIATAYDSLGNVVQRSDTPNNTVQCMKVDQALNREVIRLEGGSSCPADLTTYQTTGTERKISTQWHADWRQVTKVAEPGRITTYVYNGQPDPFNANAIASCAPATALLPDGKPVAVLCRQVEQATSDANGSLGFSATLQAGVANREQKWTYNQWGQVLSHDGPRTDVADITTYSYYSDTSFTGVGSAAVGHTIGDLQSMTNAAGKVTQYTKYDKHGQLLESVDPNGVVTTSTYDLRQRLLSTSVGGQTTSYTYDPAGQLKRVTKPDASWIGFDYDPAHRQTAVYDNLGNRIEYTLDNAGNRTAENVKDTSGALRRQLARSIDALGRVQQVTGAP